MFGKEGEKPFVVKGEYAKRIREQLIEVMKELFPESITVRQKSLLINKRHPEDTLEIKRSVQAGEQCSREMDYIRGDLIKNRLIDQEKDILYNALVKYADEYKKDLSEGDIETIGKIIDKIPLL